MRRFAYRKIVSACVHPERLCALVVVACKVGHVDVQRDGLARVGLKQLGLFIVHKLNGGLLNVALFIGELRIQLHHRLAGNFAGVGYRHLCDGGGAVFGNFNAVEVLREGGVRKAVAERIGDFPVVYPLAVGIGKAERARLGVVCRIGAGLGGHRAAGIVRKQTVGISRLVIAVAGVYAFGLHEVRVDVHARVLVVRIVVRGIVGGHLFGIAPLCGRAVVLNGGRSGAVHRIDVAQPARGVDLALERLRHGLEAVDARIAYPHYGVDAVVRLEAFDLHLVYGVDEHDHLIEVGLGGVDERLLLRADAQNVARIRGDARSKARGARREGGIFTARPAENDYSGVVIVPVTRVAVVYAYLGERELLGIGGAVIFRIYGRQRAITLAAPLLVCKIFLICAQHVGIYVEMLGKIRFYRAAVGVVIYNCLVGDAAARGAAVVRREAAYAQQRHLGLLLRERKSVALVFEKHERFGSLAYGKLLHLLYRVGGAFIARAVRPLAVVLVHLEAGAYGAGVFVERRLILFHDYGSRNRQHKYESKDERQPAKQSCFVVHKSSCLDFFLRAGNLIHFHFLRAIESIYVYKNFTTAFALVGIKFDLLCIRNGKPLTYFKQNTTKNAPVKDAFYHFYIITTKTAKPRALRLCCALRIPRRAAEA